MLVNQRGELDARDLIIKGVFQNEAVLIQILSDSVNGIPFITKILTACCVSDVEKVALVVFVRSAHASIHSKHDPTGNYKKLMDELDSICDPSHSVPKLVRRKASLSGFHSNLSSPARNSTRLDAEEPLQHQKYSTISLGIYPTPFASPSPFLSPQQEGGLNGHQPFYPSHQ